MANEKTKVTEYLLNKLNFTPQNLHLVDIYVKKLMEYNQRYNLISKSDEKSIWHRHVLDSAQLVKFIDFSDNNSLVDLGSGSGLPGMIIGIFNPNPLFHVKLYEKSPVKCEFLQKISSIVNKNIEIHQKDILEENIISDYAVARAFKKMTKIIEISREKSKNFKKIIILKGKSAQEEINSALKTNTFRYKLEASITDKQSKIVIVDTNKID